MILDWTTGAVQQLPLYEANGFFTWTGAATGERDLVTGILYIDQLRTEALYIRQAVAASAYIRRVVAETLER